MGSRRRMMVVWEGLGETLSPGGRCGYWLGESGRRVILGLQGSCGGAGSGHWHCGRAGLSGDGRICRVVARRGWVF